MQSVLKVKCFRRTTCWVPTWAGWILILGALGLAAFGGVRMTMPFLAIHQPVAGRFLVIEGWVPDYAFREAIDVFRRGGYERLLVTGTGIEKGRHLSAEKSYAQLGAGTLKSFGFEEERIVVLPSPHVQKDRTYTTALAVKEWLLANNHSDALDVVTVGPHARRTRLLYSMALGGRNAVGVIALPNTDYDPRRWWRSSYGVRETVNEMIAYLYARFLFHRSED